MILVTGATGTVGSELVKRLAAGGYPVRAMTRDPKSHTFPKGIEVVAGDFAKSHTVADALRGIQRVFLLTAGERLASRDATLIAAAQKAGVAHIVKLSVLGVGHGSKDPITQWHEAGEEAIRRSGLSWTFIRPGGFMSNALMWADSIKTQRAVYAPYSNDRVSIIDPYDIAAVAACALTQPGRESKVYELSGPDALTPHEQVDKISKSIGSPIRFTDIPPEAAEGYMRAGGMSPTLANAVVQSLAQAQHSFSAKILNTVAEVTGNKPHSFEQWIREHVAVFRT